MYAQNPRFGGTPAQGRFSQALDSNQVAALSCLHAHVLESRGLHRGLQAGNKQVIRHMSTNGGET